MTLSWYALGTAANPLPAAFCREGTVLEIKLSVQRSCPPGKGPFSWEYHQNEHPPVPSDNFNHGPFVDLKMVVFHYLV